MRDAHRMKEKFDVSLDNRQIVSLLIAGIIVMGAVFVLGVVVGKKLAGNAETAGAPDLLSALDANAHALQEAQKEPPLTFQDELTRKAAAEPVAPPAAPKPAPAKPAPAKPVAVAPPAPAPAEKPQPPAEKPSLEGEPPEEVASNSADDELAALAAKRPQVAPAAPPARVAAPPPAGKVEQEPTPTRTTAPGGTLKEAIARVTQPPAEAVKGGAFTLQISAFQSREEADRFAARLRDRGYAPYILAAEVPNKGTWYRVRMGSFPSRDAATRYLADFKRETQLNAFVAGTN
ncbi:SPOR domain-containing protein [Stigmatella sp. ncwal1]|uniref:SPOR domain-containing protein n=1 Tax=Stigmatella ashevillensis TaxID=2995309 RepID=A0ABT5D0A8_9BACT|nr:SPOR domain-containing protein [Stigmatella ashevillena]MDC0707016.1 SPOR domain-containing protein [Stigmatella ashevillena]